MNENRALPERPSPQETLISVVLPVYNEAEVLPLLLQSVVDSLDGVADYEILFINDGSTDCSPQMLDQLAAENGRVRVLHFSRNFGHQAAVHAGMTHARGNAVVLMDSDMQDRPDAIPRFIEAWREGYDVVYAIRTDRKESPAKKFLFTAFHRLMSRMASIDLPADAGNFGLVDRRVARQVAAMGESDRYFPGLRSWVGFRQKGIEVERNARYDDQPRVSLSGLGRLAKTAIFSFSSFPLSIFYVISISAMVVFLGLSCFSLYCKLVIHEATPGWTSHILVGSFFGALNAMGICILGEYIIRIYDQVRGRPLYLIDRTVNSELPAEEEDRSGDTPYVELMEQAVRLLEAGTLHEGPAPDVEFHASVPQSDDEWADLIVFPLHND